MTGEGPTTPPTVVVRGNPTTEEIAAVIAVIAGARPADREQPAGTPGSAPGSQWAAYWRGLRAPIQPGPGAWRQSARC